MSQVHPTALVDRGARISAGVRIGPYVIVEKGVSIGEETRILTHSIIKEGTRIGKNCVIGESAILGGLPQDTRFQGEESYLEIGDGVTVREFATLHRATGQGDCTRIGDHSYVMAYVHVSHNCKIGSRVTIANACQLAGHVQVGDGAFLGGSTGVHQFVRIGRLAMVGAHSYLTQDLPPFLLGSGHPFRVVGINKVGLDRAGMSSETRSRIAKLYRLVFADSRPRDQALKDLGAEDRVYPEVADFLRFMEDSTRGIRLKSADFDS
jgi:UDP-N-acetylglucosamine acyltransferase